MNWHGIADLQQPTTLTHYDVNAVGRGDEELNSDVSDFCRTRKFGDAKRDFASIEKTHSHVSHHANSRPTPKAEPIALPRLKLRVPLLNGINGPLGGLVLVAAIAAIGGLTIE